MAEAALLMKESWFVTSYLRLTTTMGKFMMGFIELNAPLRDTILQYIKCHYIIMSRLDKHSEDLLL